jgi:hypothetical protein
MSDDSSDFEADKREIVAQEDSYRQRHHDTKLSLYSGFFAFEGLTLAAAALLASRVDTHAVVRIVLGLTLVSCVILFIQYHWLLTFYDRMGYPRLRLRSPADLEKYYAETESDGEYFRRRRKLRRVGDRLLFVFAFAEIILLGYAATRTI